MNKIRNEYMRGRAQVEQFVDKVGEARLTCAEEGQQIFWAKDVDAGAREAEKRNITEHLHGCSDRGHAEGRCDGRGCQGSRVRWRQKIHCGEPPREQLKEEERMTQCLKELMVNECQHSLCCVWYSNWKILACEMVTVISVNPSLLTTE